MTATTFIIWAFLILAAETTVVCIIQYVRRRKKKHTRLWVVRGRLKEKKDKIKLDVSEKFYHND